MKPLLYIRKFLNKDSGTACIEARATQLTNVKSGMHGVDAEIKIADCHRTVTLNFYLASSAPAADRKLMALKARTLKDSVSRFADAVLLYCGDA